MGDHKLNSRFVPFAVLVLGLLMVVDAHAQNRPQLPSASACTERTLSFTSSGWDSLTHLANVKTFDGLTLPGEDTQTKYQTTGIACPIVWAGTSAYVSVHGYHEYQMALTGFMLGDTTQIDE